MKSKRDEMTFNGKDGYAEISLVGHSSDFYAFDKKKNPSWSGWVKSSNGSFSFWERCKKALKANDKGTFQKIVDEIFEKFPR